MMYPVMLTLSKKKITVIGGGRVAYRKVKALLAFGGKVQVIAPSFYNEFETIESAITMVQAYVTEDGLQDLLQASFLVFAATNDSVLNKAIGEYCEVHQLLCNVIDNQALSSFILPAYIKRGDLTISISTGGKSPSLTKKIKEDLEGSYDTSYEAYINCLGRIREWVIREIDDPVEKEYILKHIITLNLEELEMYEKSHFGS